MKKTVSLLLSGALIAASLLSVGAASPSDFSDMPDDWSTKALTAAVENGLLTGSDGQILPKDNLTRAQMATIIVRAFNASSSDSLAGFTDVPADSWYFPYMQKAVAMKVFTGDGSGLLTPEANITREQVFVVLARAFGLSSSGTSSLDKFSDRQDIASWAAPYAAALVEKGYVNGSNGMLNPKSNITRAEFAQIMYNMVSAYIDTPQTITGTYAGNVIIRSSNVTVAASAKIGGVLVVCEGCSKIRVENKASAGAILDATGEVTYGISDNGSGNSGSNSENSGSGEDIFWVVNPGEGTSPSGDGSDHIGDDNSDEGWSEIYRP